jgi:hypothetical protein
MTVWTYANPTGTTAAGLMVSCAQLPGQFVSP